MRCSGPLIGAPATIGLMAATGARVARSASRMPRSARIGPMLTNGLLGGMMTSVGVAQRARSTPGAGRAWRAPRSVMRVHAAAAAAAYEILLEGQGAACRRPSTHGAHRRRRSSAARVARTPCARRWSRGDRGQRAAAAQRVGAKDVRGEVACRRGGTRSRRRSAAERVEAGEACRRARPQPCARIDDAGQRVDDRVEVGRDVQAEEGLVVAGVDDDREAARIKKRAEAP